ncbi:MAG TPA: hypothetical protein VGJ05_02005 [Fimbriiglobus sp.]|jgi:hypothetical protein
MFRISCTPLFLLGVLIPLFGTVRPAAAAPPIKKVEPEWMPAFREAYELKEGEYVKRVTKPWIPSRIEFRMRAFKPLAKDTEGEKYLRASFKKFENWMTLIVDQDGNELTQRYCISNVGLAMSPTDQRGENLFSVQDAVKWITGFSEQEFIIDPKHRDDPLFNRLNVHGDFVVRKNTPLDKLAAQLGAILRDQCKIDVELKVIEEVQEVLVVSGKFDLNPPAWREKNKQLLDVYATEDGLNKDFYDSRKYQTYTGRVFSTRHTGYPMQYVRFLGERVKARMLWEGGVPDGPKFSWNNHFIGNATAQEAADNNDPEKVLKHATEQCGLTFKKERRKVPVLVLTPREKK